MKLRTYLVTGANTGLGLNAVRQLALRDTTGKVYMACHLEKSAQNAILQLTDSGEISRQKLEYVHFDACSSKSEITEIVDILGKKNNHNNNLGHGLLDGVILNAGGHGHDGSGRPTGPNSVINMYQLNLIGHAQLIDILIESELLKTGARIVCSGSEAARGVRILMIGNPEMGDSVDWYTHRLTGGHEEGQPAPSKAVAFSPMDTYAMVKGFMALYWSAWARRHPEFHVLTVSPGATAGTGAASTTVLPIHYRVLTPIVMPLLLFLGISHSLDVGTERYIDALLGQGEMSLYASGTFVASRSGASGPVCDQTELTNGQKYGEKSKQEAAFIALSPYV